MNFIITGWLSPLLVVSAIAGILVYLNNERIKNKLCSQCCRYAGLDWVSQSMLGGVSWERVLEGLRAESKSLGHRANQIPRIGKEWERNKRLRNAPDILEIFFVQTISGKCNPEIRKQALRLGYEARYRSDESDFLNGPYGGNVKSLSLYEEWESEVYQWVRLVDRVGYTIAQNAQKEAAYRSSKRS